MLEETTITCPHCWETISVLLDLSGEDQAYIEDCSVCCRPIQIRYEVTAGELAGLSVASAA